MDPRWPWNRRRDEPDITDILIDILRRRRHFKEAWRVYSNRCMRGAYGENWVRVHPKITVCDNIVMGIFLVFGILLVLSWKTLCLSASVVYLAFTDKGIFREISFPVRWIIMNR